MVVRVLFVDTKQQSGYIAALRHKNVAMINKMNIKDCIDFPQWHLCLTLQSKEFL